MDKEQFVWGKMGRGKKNLQKTTLRPTAECISTKTFIQIYTYINVHTRTFICIHTRNTEGGKQVHWIGRKYLKKSAARKITTSSRPTANSVSTKIFVYIYTHIHIHTYVHIDVFMYTEHGGEKHVHWIGGKILEKKWGERKNWVFRKKWGEQNNWVFETHR